MSDPIIENIITKDEDGSELVQFAEKTADLL